jgi:germination protein M
VRKLITVLSAMLLLVFAGCAGSANQSALITQKDQEIASLREKTATLEAQLKTEQEKNNITQVALYFLQQTSTDFFLKPEVRQVKPEENMPMVALKELIAGPKESGNKPLLPNNTKVNSVHVKDGIATVDFGDEITKLNVGARLEALTVASIVNTLTKFPAIERVQLLVNGKTVETLAGHMDISKPLFRNDRDVKL